jgi:hypothetical protein
MLPIVPWLVLAAAHGIVVARAGRLGRWLATSTLVAGALLAAIPSAVPALWFRWRIGSLISATLPSHAAVQSAADLFSSPPLPPRGLVIASAALLLLAVVSLSAARRVRGPAHADAL